MHIKLGLLDQIRREKSHVQEDARPRIRYEPKLIMQDNVPYIVRLFRGRYGENGEDPAFLHYRGWSVLAAPNFRTKDGRPGVWITCNCHNGRRKLECVPHAIDLKYYREKGKHIFRASPFRAINLIAFGKWHKVPNPTNPGRFHYELCKGTNCLHCKAGTDYVSWRKLHIDVDSEGWNELGLWERRIQSKCKNCDDGEILPTTAICPICNSEIPGDLERFRLMELEQIICPYCDNKVAAQLEYACFIRDRRTGVVKKGCDNPDCYTIWDCDLEIVQVPKKSGRGKQLKLLSYYPAPIEDEEILRAMEQPFSFKAYDWCPPEEQALLMGVENPYKET